MKGHETNHRAASYDALDASVTAKLGLPDGLLASVRTNGERTDADQVSKVGARTVYQIIPATRRAAIEKYGIDPYLSAENASEVAGRLLKDSLDRNGGDPIKAVTEYVGGTDPKRHGPVTRAYVARVTGTPAPDLSASFGRQARAAPTIPDAILTNYNTPGAMSPADRKRIDDAVKAGSLSLPAGATLTRPQEAAKPNAAMIPKRVIDNYNNRSEMTDAERDILDRDVGDGLIALPQGVTLKRPDPLTPGQTMAMGAGGIARGVAGLGDVIINTPNAVIDLASTMAGQKAPFPTTPLLVPAVEQVLKTAGVQSPATRGEKITDAMIQGGAQGLATAGVGGLLSGARGITGAVGRAIAASPVVDTLSSAVAGGSAEKARQEGAGAVGQLGAALVGGGATALSAASLERVAAKFGTKAAKVVEAVPERVVFDERGAITEEGIHQAERADVAPAELKAAYAEAGANEPAPAPASRAPEPATADAAPPVLSSNEAAAVERAGVKVAEDGTVDPASVSAKAAEAAPAPGAVTGTAVDPNAPLPATAAARLKEASSEGIPLTKGQATQDFAAQDAEQTLKAQASGEGERARAFLARQQEAIAGAIEKFRSTLGDPSMNATERGAVVKDALREMADQGRAGVTALYKQAREIAQGLGDNARSVLDLDTSPLLARMRELWIDEAVPEQVRNALRQKAAQYGLIGKSPKTVEGITAVELLDDKGKVAERIKFTGPVRRLSVDNAEDLRQTINDLYVADTSRRSQGLKHLIDSAVSDAVERAAVEGQGDVGAAFKAGREAFITQKKTFSARDVIQRLIDFKKGTQTDAVLPENAIREIFAGGPEGLTTLKKIKAILLSKPTTASRAAWKAIQAHGVADIFKAALSPSGDISGARLSSAIKKFGPDKLKVLLDPAEFGQLMKLQRIIKTATVPLPNTTNPSGSGYKVIQFLSQQAQRLGPVASVIGGPIKPVVDAVAGLVKTGQEASAAKATLEGVTNFTPEAAVITDAKAAAPKADIKAGTVDAIRAFLDLAASTRLIAPLIAGTSAASQPQKDRP